MGNVTVSAKSKFLVVALENVAMLHSPKVLWNWITLQSLLKQSFYAVALENVAMLHSPKVLWNLSNVIVSAKTKFLCRCP